MMRAQKVQEALLLAAYEKPAWKRVQHDGHRLILRIRTSKIMIFPPLEEHMHIYSNDQMSHSKFGFGTKNTLI